MYIWLGSQFMFPVPHLGSLNLLGRAAQWSTIPAKGEKKKKKKKENVKEKGDMRLLMVAEMRCVNATV